MNDEDGRFGEPVAAVYDESADEMFAPDVVDPESTCLPTSPPADGRDGRVEKSSGPFRSVWPAELDLMAQLAGMELSERWTGWGREPFTSESRQHVSVWTKP